MSDDDDFAMRPLIGYCHDLSKVVDICFHAFLRAPEMQEAELYAFEPTEPILSLYEKI